MYCKKNWGSMAEKDPPLGRIDMFQTSPRRCLKIRALVYADSLRPLFLCLSTLDHKEGKGAGGHCFAPGVGDDHLDDRQTAPHLFGGGLAEQVAQRGTQIFHAAGGGDAAAPSRTGAAAGHRVGQGSNGSAVDVARRVNRVGPGMEHAPGQAGLGVGEFDSIFIRKLARAVDHTQYRMFLLLYILSPPYKSWALYHIFSHLASQIPYRDIEWGGPLSTSIRTSKGV